MSHSERVYQSWGKCIDCHYEGMLEYRTVPGEDYAAVDLAVVMLLRCPACGTEDHTMLMPDYYREIVEADNG